MAVLLVRFVLFSAGGSVFLGGRAVFFGIGFRVKQALLLPVFTRSESTALMLPCSKTKVVPASRRATTTARTRISLSLTHSPRCRGFVRGFVLLLDR